MGEYSYNCPSDCPAPPEPPAVCNENYYKCTAQNEVYQCKGGRWSEPLNCLSGFTCLIGQISSTNPCNKVADCNNDGNCDAGETKENCPYDCAPKPYCGDGTCGMGEYTYNCPEDCGYEERLCGSCFDFGINIFRSHEAKCDADEFVLTKKVWYMPWTWFMPNISFSQETYCPIFLLIFGAVGVVIVVFVWRFVKKR
jgi:hypothetical protein